MLPFKFAFANWAEALPSARIRKAAASAAVIILLIETSLVRFAAGETLARYCHLSLSNIEQTNVRHHGALGHNSEG
jgi:hypothetical protein